MPNHRIDRDEFVDNVSEEDRDKAVLSMMLVGASWPWTVDEIACELDTQSGAEDSVERLSRAGLLHCLGPFVFPTRAARRADQIGAGSI